MTDEKIEELLDKESLPEAILMTTSGIQQLKQHIKTDHYRGNKHWLDKGHLTELFGIDVFTIEDKYAPFIPELKRDTFVFGTLQEIQAHIEHVNRIKRYEPRVDRHISTR